MTDTLKPKASTIRRGSSEALVERHPAFGMIRASRVHRSGKSTLFGANFDVSDRIMVEVCTATVESYLQTEWHHSGNLVLRLEMTEAQWATFVSSLNYGSGTPCTFTLAPPDDTPLETKPRIDRPHAGARRAEHIRRSVEEDLDQLRAAVAKLDEIIAGGKLTKGALAEVRSLLRRAVDNAPANYQFAADQVTEHMGILAEELKAQIHAHETMLRLEHGERPLKSLTPTSLTLDEPFE